MSPEIIAAFAITWGAIGSLFVVLWNHVGKCNERQQQMGELIEAVRELKLDQKDPR